MLFPCERYAFSRVSVSSCVSILFFPRLSGISYCRIAVLTCGEAEGKAKLSPPPRSQVKHLVPAHIVRRNKVLDEVSTAIPRDRDARNATIERLGGERKLCWATQQNLTKRTTTSHRSHDPQVRSNRLFDGFS